MNRTLAAAGAALALGVALATTVHSQETPAPARLGFLDVRKAFDAYRKAHEVREQIKKKNDELVAAFRQRMADVEKETERLSTLNPGSDEAVALTRQIKLMKYTIEVDKEMNARQLDAEQRKKNWLIYVELVQEADAWRAENGYAAILHSFANQPEMEKDLELVVSTRMVLCADPSLDVTKAVVDRLNAQLPPPK